MLQMQLEPGWYNSIALDLTYRAGNTDLLTTRARFRSDYLSKVYHGFVFGNLQYGTNYINWTGRLDERITTSATGYYQAHLRRFQDYRILFEGSLTFQLTAKLAFPLRVNFRYDNEPPTGIRKHDVEIFNGLRYTF